MIEPQAAKILKLVELHIKSLKLLSDIGIIVEIEESLKKHAHKKYHRRFAWRWLSKTDKQQAILDAILRKK